MGTDVDDDDDDDESESEEEIDEEETAKYIDLLAKSRSARF